MAGMNLLAVAVVSIVLPAALVVLVRQRRARHRAPFSALRSFGASQGLVESATDRGLVLRGELRGCAVEISLPTRAGSPLAMRAEVVVAMGSEALAGLRLTQETLGARGARAVPPGDAVGSGPPPLLRDSRLRTQLVRFFGRWPAGRIEEGCVRLSASGVGTPGGVEALRDGLQLANGLLAALERRREHEEDQERTPGALPVRARFPATEPEATLAAWCVEVGDEVQRGQPICELLTGLGTLPMLATTTGEVVRRVGSPGRTLRNGALLLEIEAATGEHLPAQPKPPNASGLELLDLDHVSLHRVDEVRAARELRLDVDSPRPPRERASGLGARKSVGNDPADRASFAGVSWTALAASLSDPALLTSQRNALLGPHRVAIHSLEFLVTQVDWTTGMLLPPHLQRGRTVTGHLDGGAPQVTVRMPAVDNGALDALPCTGEDWLTVSVRLRDWDGLHRRLVFDAVVKAAPNGRSPSP